MRTGSYRPSATPKRRAARVSPHAITELVAEGRDAFAYEGAPTVPAGRSIDEYRAQGRREKGSGVGSRIAGADCRRSCARREHQTHTSFEKTASPAVVRAAGLVAVLIAAALSLPAPGAIAHTPEQAPSDGRTPDARAQALPEEDPARGLTYDGIAPGREDGPCEGMFELRSDEGRLEGCTHGPDPAPVGVDVREQRSTEELLAEANVAGAEATVDDPGGIAIAPRYPDWDPGANARPDQIPPAPKVPCTGDSPRGSIGHGTEGRRVQAIYAYPSDLPGGSRFMQVAGLIESFAGEVDQIFYKSAIKTGGERHVRFVHDDVQCRVMVREVELSPSGDDSFANTISELRAKGPEYRRFDRKYLIWMDPNRDCVNPAFSGGDPNCPQRKSADMCGMGELLQDRHPLPKRNKHNGNSSVPGTPQGMFARVDVQCWGKSATPSQPLPKFGGWTVNPIGFRGAHSEAHELMHTLGGVQAGSPNSTWGPFGNNPGGHCIDEFDVMCYDDDGNPQGSTQDGVVNHPQGPDVAVAKLMRSDCPPSDEMLFDCNNDDYYSTSPASGTWLAINWNTADSSFLDKRPAEDRDPPTLTGPVYQQLGAGTSTVPFEISWRAVDSGPYCGSKIRGFYLWMQKDGGGWSIVNSAPIHSIPAGCSLHGSVNLSLARGAKYTFAVRTVDGAGNSSWSYGNSLAVP